VSEEGEILLERRAEMTSPPVEIFYLPADAEFDGPCGAFCASAFGAARRVTASRIPFPNSPSSDFY
jgi:hypothetical protein